MTHALEKRGYVKAGPWTPECTVEHPDGGQFYFNSDSLQSSFQVINKHNHGEQ